MKRATRKLRKAAETHVRAYEESLYEKLREGVETKAADVLYRIMDDDAERRAKEASVFSAQPLHVMLVQAVRVVVDVAADIGEARSAADVVNAFLVEGRSAYIGVALIVIAVVGLLACL